ncbi:MAG: hypothetical protein ACPLRN_01800 [Microgenomates group bacterium]
MIKTKKIKKAEIATLMTLVLVVVGAVLTVASSILTNRQKNLASNPRALELCEINQRNCIKECGSISLCSSNCAKQDNVPDEGTADRICITPTRGPNGCKIGKCGSGCQYDCPTPADSMCSDKPGLEFGCYVASNGKFYGCIGTPCRYVSGVKLVSKDELNSLSLTPGYIPPCQGGSYVEEKDCEITCGENNCRKCRLGSYTIKYECNIDYSTVPQCPSDKTHYYNSANCKICAERHEQCTYCQINGTIYTKCGGSGPVFGTPTPTRTPKPSLTSYFDYPGTATCPAGTVSGPYMPNGYGAKYCVTPTPIKTPMPIKTTMPNTTSTLTQTPSPTNGALMVSAIEESPTPTPDFSNNLMIINTKGKITGKINFNCGEFCNIIKKNNFNQFIEVNLTKNSISIWKEKYDPETQISENSLIYTFENLDRFYGDRYSVNPNIYTLIVNLYFPNGVVEEILKRENLQFGINELNKQIEDINYNWTQHFAKVILNFTYQEPIQKPVDLILLRPFYDSDGRFQDNDKITINNGINPISSKAFTYFLGNFIGADNSLNYEILWSCKENNSIISNYSTDPNLYLWLEGGKIYTINTTITCK